MAIYKRSRIWQMLEETTNYLTAVFDREGKEIFEPTMEKFNRPKDGWVNRVWETPQARRCHLDVVDARGTKGLYMFHCCVFLLFYMLLFRCRPACCRADYVLSDSVEDVYVWAKHVGFQISSFFVSNLIDG